MIACDAADEAFFCVPLVCDDTNGMHAVYRLVCLESMNALRTEDTFRQSVCIVGDVGSSLTEAVDRWPWCIGQLVVTVFSECLIFKCQAHQVE